MYDFPCEYCEGRVGPKKVAQEAFKHRDGFIILQDVTIGVCRKCGNRCYSADILRAVHELASGNKTPVKMAEVPIGNVA
jgi:YgiT-type zinc finger domain-containing protein